MSLTRAEQYFLEQLASELGSSEVIATGYFRTLIASSRSSVGAFVSATMARGHFLALTDDKLLVVLTRAPAFSAPLLENIGLMTIPLSGIRKLVLGTGAFVIQTDDATLTLEARVSNEAFPQQGRLIDELARRFNLSETVASLVVAQTRQRRLVLAKVAAMMIACIIVGVLWALYGPSRR